VRKVAFWLFLFLFWMKALGAKEVRREPGAVSLLGRDFDRRGNWDPEVGGRRGW
jgi:hypothetical protein